MPAAVGDFRAALEAHFSGRSPIAHCARIRRATVPPAPHRLRSAAVLLAGAIAAGVSEPAEVSRPGEGTRDRTALRRLLPSQPQDPEPALQALARASDVTVQVRLPADPAEAGRTHAGDSPAGLMYAARELEGRGIEEKVVSFLEGLGGVTPPCLLRRAALETAGGRQVRFTARLELPYLPEPVPLETLVREAGNLSSQPSPLLELRRLAVALRTAAGPVALSSWSGPDGAVAAYVIGSTGAMALREAAAKLGLEPRWRPGERAACRPFGLAPKPVDPTEPDLTALRVPSTDEERLRDLPGLFDVDDLCGEPPSVAETARVPLKPRRTGSGPLRLRLRDVDVVDVLRILHELSGLDFVEDEDVTGRVTLDWDGVFAEDVLTELVAAGFNVSPPGSLRRISSVQDAGPAGPALPAGTGGPISLDFKKGRLDDLLRLFADVSDLEFLAPPGLAGRVSVQVADRPWEDCFQAILATAGLRYTVEGRRIHVAPEAPEAALVAQSRGKHADPLVSYQSSDQSHRRWWRRLEATSVRDLALAGLAREDGVWVGYVYTPERRLYSVRSGQKFLDGAIRSVDGEGVVVEWNGKTVRVPLPS